ncbi:MAG: hypothetical protein ISS47_01275 [Candidatus Omnitrophica bacterium]|nr:hypothetical protein [Candidatus Omnitrophota bacterium]
MLRSKKPNPHQGLLTCCIIPTPSQPSPKQAYIDTPLLQNTDYRFSARVLGFHSQQPIINLDPGRHRLLWGEIYIFNHDKAIIAKRGEIKKTSAIAQGPLGIYFRNGESKLYCRNREITQNGV